MTRPTVAALRAEWEAIRDRGYYPPDEYGFVERLLAALEAGPSPPSRPAVSVLDSEAQRVLYENLWDLYTPAEASLPLAPPSGPWEIVAKDGLIWVASSRGRVECATLLDAERTADALKALDRGEVLREPSLPPQEEP